MLDLFKDIVGSILVTKENVIKDELDAKEYKPYIVNKALSYHLDCVPYANMMNECVHLDPDMEYQFYLNSIRGYKRRFQPWQTAVKVKDLETVKEYFQYGDQKALEALKILTDDQIEDLRKQMDKGGVKR